MKVDLVQARLAYDLGSGEYNKMSPNFACFSPAYVATNEDVREVLRVLRPTPGARVLTVAGSGDQALFYKLSGAGHVDTFDITFNAKMMMDIKTAAIGRLPHIEYLSLLNNIRYSRDISNVPQYKQIVDYVPNDTREYVDAMRGAHLVRGGMLDTVLFKNEYAKIGEIIKEPFNFIWTDLGELSAHVTQNYDQIYLSNILQYNAQPQYVVNVICDLMTRLNPGGKILVNVAPWFDGEELVAMKILQQKLEQANVARVKFFQNNALHMCFLEKR